MTGHFVYASCPALVDACAVPALRCTNRATVEAWLAGLGCTQLVGEHAVRCGEKLCFCTLQQTTHKQQQRKARLPACPAHHWLTCPACLRHLGRRLPELSAAEKRQVLSPDQPVWSRPAALSGNWHGIRCGHACPAAPELAKHVKSLASSCLTLPAMHDCPALGAGRRAGC